MLERQIKIVDNYNIPNWSIFEHKDPIVNTYMHYIDNIAYAIISKDSDGIGYFLHKIEVNKEYQGKGYGKYLMNYLINKYQSIYFEPRNAKHRFYLRLGAKPFIKHSTGWLFAINNNLPSDNWKLWGGEGFCTKPNDNFTYKPEEWPSKLLELFA